MKNRYEEFKGMCPYEGTDFENAVERLRNSTALLDHFADVIMQDSVYQDRQWVSDAKKRLRDSLEHVHCYDDFQKKITIGIFLEYIINHSLSSLSWSGIDNLNPDEAYIFISSHRDIILDTALLDFALFKNNMQMCEMFIGNNLISSQFVLDLFNVNGSVLVNRSASSRDEFRESVQKMSAYTRYCIIDKKKSMWVAQKSGRSKDGRDDTSGAVLKMLSQSYKTEGRPFKDFLSEIKVVPVAISYQFDPCDVSKGIEEVRRFRIGDAYKKKPYADMFDMVHGLRNWKGAVHVSVGTPLSPDCITLTEAVSEIDRQIHRNYYLCDTNYFAWDTVNNTDRFKDKYADFNSDAFLKRVKVRDLDVTDFVLHEYSNPVDSYLNSYDLGE